MLATVRDSSHRGRLVAMFEHGIIIVTARARCE